MKNIIITALTPLAFFGAYSLFTPGNDLGNIKNETEPLTAPIYKADRNNAQTTPETCLLAEDTFSSKPILVKKDPAHHNITLTRAGHPGKVNIKF
jgi:hypothetical protein